MVPWRAGHACWIAVLLSPAIVGAEYDPCECVDWAFLYGTKPAHDSDFKKILCGEGFEWSAGKPPPTNFEQIVTAKSRMGFAYYEICESFFHRMTNNYCVNTAHAEYGTEGFEGQTWCYVRNECMHLNGGDRLWDKKDYYYGPEFLNGWFKEHFKYWYETLGFQRNVRRDYSWKICTKGEDKRLRDLHPSQVLQLGKNMDSVIGFVTKMAYGRLMPTYYAWDKVKDAVLSYDLESMPATLRRAVEANDSIVIDVDPEGHTHQRIVKGKELYELTCACNSSACGWKQWPFKRLPDLGADVAEAPGSAKAALAESALTPDTKVQAFSTEASISASDRPSSATSPVAAEAPAAEAKPAADAAAAGDAATVDPGAREM